MSALSTSTPEAIITPAAAYRAAGIVPYASTIFSSATLLFLIQPIIAKEMLPWLGGAAAVWGACMVFFQSLLLLGYLYAHSSIRWLGLRAQAVVHLTVLALGGASLFFLSPSHPNASAADHPAAAAILFLTAKVGLPYFVLSSTSPLLQAWYSRGGGRSLPYRLFALSNLSSLLALVAYPFVVEPNLDLDWQFLAWRWCYAGFAVFCAWIALRSVRYQLASPGLASPEIVIDRNRQPRRKGNWQRNLRWLALAWCSSALLLGVTNNLCQNIAPMPLMWIAPLAIYLFTFVLCFDHEGWYRVSVYRVLMPFALAGLLWTDANAGLRAYEAIPICLSGLLIACMFCHGQLAALKPAACELTSFYLYMSLGGALGGMFVGLFAPVLFVDLFEVRIAIAACFVLSLRFLFNYRSKVFLLTAAAITVFLFHALMGISARTPAIFRGRSFYGALAVNESHNAAGIAVRVMVHGRVIHGGQWLTPTDRLEPRYYYGRESGAGIALERATSNRVGIVGLGAGTIASYGKPGDVYRFYEINPLVTDAANTLFTYLSDSRAQTSVLQGDARLTLDREPAQHFDILVLDAFSGDSIPVHLLTQEAFRGYFRHLNENGVLAVNCSSQYLDLPPVVAEIAATLGRPAMLVDSPDHADQNISHAIWVLVTRDSAFLDEVQRKHHGERIPVGRRKPWTDRYSNILAAIR